MHQELTTEEGKELIDQLVAMKIISFQFAGGEPLVRKDFMELAEYICKKNIYTTIATNGILIDRDKARDLKKIGIKAVQISLDGSNAPMHEFLRGKNTFDKTVAAIENLRSEGIPVMIAAMLHKKNYDDMSDLLYLSNKIGVKSFRTQFFLPQGRGKDNEQFLILSREQLRTKITEMDNHPLVKEKRIHLVLPCFAPNIIKTSMNVNDDSSKLFSNGCGAGTVQMNINPYGDITACGILTDNEWTCGNFREDTLENIWLNSEGFAFWREEMKLQGCCGTCDFLNSCGGGCRASA